LFREKIPARQLSAWLFTAIVPVGLQLMSDSFWGWGGIGGIFGFVLSWMIWHNPREIGKAESIILLIYVWVLLGELLDCTAQSWPVGKSDPAVPLILVVLAAWSGHKGPAAAARVGTVLFWVVLGLYLAVFAAGAQDMQIRWLVPHWNTPDELGILSLLLPCAAAGLLQNPASPGKKGWLTVLYLVAGAMITAGVLSPAQTTEMSNAFYELSRSLNFLGVARRFEALICAGTTVGWFALLSLLLTLCGTYFQNIFSGGGRTGVWLSAVGGTVLKLCGLHINPMLLLMMGAVFWVAMPLLAQGLGKIKKS
jgi:hypothetical protein